MTIDTITIVKKFPRQPKNQIAYYVYDEKMIEPTKKIIREIHGEEYLNKYVVVSDINNNSHITDTFSIYYDPLVFKYKNAWNN